MDYRAPTPDAPLLAFSTQVVALDRTTGAERWKYPMKNVITAKAHLDVPLRILASGERCNQTSHYLTAPGLYAIDITLNGHIHSSAAPPVDGERGEPVRLEAPTINVRAS